MRFVDEYRDPAVATALIAQITDLAGDDSFKFMEVCGGHTHTIYRHGIEHALPPTVELVHGPGCPVCVIPMGRAHDAMAIAGRPGVILTCFGDMMRVPGSRGSLFGGQGPAADIRVVYSPLDALKIAIDHPEQEVVFFAVGFETTAPSTALTVLEAPANDVGNFSVFSNHVTIVPPLKAILESPGLELDGFLGPGHVSTVIGQRPYRFVPTVYGKPLVTAGFEPLDILQTVAMLLTQIRQGRCEVETQYARVVSEEGRPAGPGRAGRGFRAPTPLRVARPRLHLPERAGPAARVGPVRRRAPSRGAGGAGGRSQGVPVRRGAEGGDQAVGVQGVRHRLHPRDARRDMHGLLGRGVRGLLQLRPDAPYGGGDPGSEDTGADVTLTVGAESAVRHRLRVTGVVQGVGFRPHVHRLATDLGLAGFVGNDSAGVFAELEGPAEAVQRFEARLVAEAPPMSAIEGVEVHSLDLRVDHGFRIVASRPVPGQATLIPPDVAVVRPVRDRAVRSCRPALPLPVHQLHQLWPMLHHHPPPALRPTQHHHGRIYPMPGLRPPVPRPGGPAVPRPASGLRGVRSPTVVRRIRRDHRGGNRFRAGRAAQSALAAGRIVAIKGIGGYHLACDATDPTAVASLRERKHRPHKPLAVMVPDLAAAREAGRPGRGGLGPPLLAREAHRARHPKAPVALAPSVAPGSPLLGLFLPYSPLHHLLFTAVPATAAPVPFRLVMTSGNLADEPICFIDAEARSRLGGIAEAWLVHDRPIHMPCDDSVVRVERGRGLPIRRARGFARCLSGCPSPRRRCWPRAAR